MASAYALGTAVVLGASTTIPFTTGTVVASGDKVVVYVGWFGSGITLNSVSGGGLTWTVDSQVSNGNEHAGLAWAEAPSGMASSTTVTPLFSAAADSRHVAGIGVTGLPTGGVTNRTSGTTGTTNWTSGSLTVATSDMIIGGCFGAGDIGSGSNTATGGNTELQDISFATDSYSATEYQIGTGASIAVQGTWTGALVNSAIAIVFASGPGVEPSVNPDITNFPKFELAGRSPV